MGNCISKKEINVLYYENTNIVEYQGCIKNNEKSGYGIQFTKDGKKNTKDNLKMTSRMDMEFYTIKMKNQYMKETF